MVQGVDFPAGSRVKTALKFNEYRLDYGYCLDLGHGLRLEPFGGIDLWDFSLKMHRHGSAGRVSRSYRKVSFQLGSKVDFRVGERLDVGVKGDAGLALKDEPRISDLGVYARWQLLRTAASRWQLVTSLDDEWLRYSDEPDKAMHNVIRMHDLVPSIGLRLSF